MKRIKLPWAFLFCMSLMTLHQNVKAQSVSAPPQAVVEVVAKWKDYQSNLASETQKKSNEKRAEVAAFLRKQEADNRKAGKNGEADAIAGLAVVVETGKGLAADGKAKPVQILDDSAGDTSDGNPSAASFDLVRLSVESLAVKGSYRATFELRDPLPKSLTPRGWFALYLDLDGDVSTGYVFRGIGTDLQIGYRGINGTPTPEIEKKSGVADECRAALTAFSHEENKVIMEIKCREFEKFEKLRFAGLTGVDGLGVDHFGPLPWPRNESAAGGKPVKAPPAAVEMLTKLAQFQKAVDDGARKKLDDKKAEVIRYLNRLEKESKAPALAASIRGAILDIESPPEKKTDRPTLEYDDSSGDFIVNSKPPSGVDLIKLTLETVAEDSFVATYQMKDAIQADLAKRLWIKLYFDLDGKSDTGYSFQQTGADMSVGIFSQNGKLIPEVAKRSTVAEALSPAVSDFKIIGNKVLFEFKCRGLSKFTGVRLSGFTGIDAANVDNFGPVLWPDAPGASALASTPVVPLTVPTTSQPNERPATATGTVVEFADSKGDFIENRTDLPCHDVSKVSIEVKPGGAEFVVTTEMAEAPPQQEVGRVSYRIYLELDGDAESGYKFRNLGGDLAMGFRAKGGSFAPEVTKRSKAADSLNLVVSDVKLSGNKWVMTGKCNDLVKLPGVRFAGYVGVDGKNVDNFGPFDWPKEKAPPVEAK